MHIERQFSFGFNICDLDPLVEINFLKNAQNRKVTPRLIAYHNWTHQMEFFVSLHQRQKKERVFGWELSECCHNNYAFFAIQICE